MPALVRHGITLACDDRGAEKPALLFNPLEAPDPVNAMIEAFLRHYA